MHIIKRILEIILITFIYTTSSLALDTDEKLLTINEDLPYKNMNKDLDTKNISKDNVSNRIEENLKSKSIKKVVTDKAITITKATIDKAITKVTTDKAITKVTTDKAITKVTTDKAVTKATTDKAITKVTTDKAITTATSGSDEKSKLDAIRNIEINKKFNLEYSKLIKLDIAKKHEQFYKKYLEVLSQTENTTLRLKLNIYAESVIKKTDKYDYLMEIYNKIHLQAVDLKFNALIFRMLTKKTILLSQQKKYKELNSMYESIIDTYFVEKAPKNIEDEATKILKLTQSELALSQDKLNYFYRSGNYKAFLSENLHLNKLQKLVLTHKSNLDLIKNSTYSKKTMFEKIYEFKKDVNDSNITHIMSLVYNYARFLKLFTDAEFFKNFVYSLPNEWSRPKSNYSKEINKIYKLL